MIGAACKGKDPSLFFPSEGKHPREALAICEGCPVKEACLSTFIDEPAGVFGGTTGRDRRALRSRRFRLSQANDMVAV